MALEPNVFAFRSRFPEFKDAPDADVQGALDVAALWVDSSTWAAGDWPMAQLFWAAHYLSLMQQETSSSQFGGTAGLFVRSIGIGERRVMFGERGAGGGKASMAAVDALLSETTYGQLFMMLRNRNVIGVLVV